MFAKLRAALMNEDGAVTVDWIVLTGGAAALAIIMMSTMNGETTDIAGEIESVLLDVNVAAIGTVGYSQ
ncbi:MAG: hypothetical protein KDK01_00035 [Rhodobacteraceae bacterium]|jgi:hypothetical protein|nr:hypothetical protein [Paracoccaceae bacterium]